MATSRLRVVESPSIPPGARVCLTHAAAQYLAESSGVDLLHVKGPASPAELRSGTGPGSDADVIVRPVHVSRFLASLRRHGWRVVTGFSRGSIFGHAANLYHPSWGLLDVHRTYPGMDTHPAHAFEVLWRRRDEVLLAHRRCPVPDRTSQHLLLLLHAARTGPPGRAHPDIGPNWTALDPATRSAVRTLAAQLDAEIGLAAATGDLAAYAGDPRAALWWHVSAGGNRLDEWVARWRVAVGPWAKASVLARSVTVNRYYLRQRLGHEPTTREIAVEFARRIGQAGADARSIAAGRLDRRDTREHR